MSLTAAKQEIACMRGGGGTAGSLPAEVSWEMLDKSRFFVLGAALFSGVSAALYPAVVLKTHLQVITYSNFYKDMFFYMINLAICLLVVPRFNLCLGIDI